MSKTTKIVAALGIVAGLGVAALPAFTYATQTSQSVTGDVNLYVEVQPAIAMTITGNNDDGLSYAYDSFQYAIVADPTGNPSENGYYERSSAGVFTASTDTTVDDAKTYFTRSADTTGVDVFAPYSVGAGEVDGRGEAFKIGPSSSYLSILPNAIGSMTSTVTVYTNNDSGYTLSLKDADDNTNLTKIYSGETPATPATIAAVASPSAGTGAGWNVAGGTGAFASGAAITTSIQTVKTTATKTTGGDATTMTYNVATAADQETGVYTDTITYTATTNN